MSALEPTFVEAFADHPAFFLLSALAALASVSFAFVARFTRPTARGRLHVAAMTSSLVAIAVGVLGTWLQLKTNEIVLAGYPPSTRADYDRIDTAARAEAAYSWRFGAAVGVLSLVVAIAARAAERRPVQQ